MVKKKILQELTHREHSQEIQFGLNVKTALILENVEESETTCISYNCKNRIRDCRF